MTQLGFYFNQQACIGCKTCQIACKDANNLPVGVLYRNVHGYETGSYPDVDHYLYSATCNHCANPACVASCPTGAMFKDSETGLVLVNSKECIGCKTCTTACPYGVPQFLEEKGVVGKCSACEKLRAKGEAPACVSSCPMRALEFGDVDELKAKHASEELNGNLVVLPKASITTPSTLINPRSAALTGSYTEDMYW